MKYLFLVAFFLPIAVYAQPQTILGNWGFASSTPGATAFVSLGGGSATAAAVQTNRQPPMPFAGTFSNFMCASDVVPGAGQSYTCTLFINGSATALTCTITAAVKNCVDNSHTVAFAVSDAVNVRETDSGTPTAAALSYAIDQTPSNQSDTWLGVQLANFSAAVENFYSFVTRATAVASITNAARSPLAEGGVIDLLNINSPTVSPGTLNYTIMQSGASTTVSCTSSSTGCVDNTHSFTVIADELDSIATTPASSPSVNQHGVSMRFTPAISGDYLIEGGTTGVNDGTSAVMYAPFQAFGPPNSTEAAVQEVSNDQVITRLSVSITTAPGLTKTRTFTLRKNAVDTGLTCQIAGTATTCTGVGNVVVSKGDLLDVGDTPAAASTASANNRWGLVAHQTVRTSQSQGIFNLFGGQLFIRGGQLFIR